MATTEWFRTKQIGNRTWVIDDHGCDLMYLICGDKKCLLVDTGWGINDLPKLIKSLSPLPLIVVNSHGHPDHSYGNCFFNEVYIHEADKPFVNKPINTEIRNWAIKNALPKSLPENFNIDTWAKMVPSLKSIKDGHVFDLGNRHLQVISVPGHSPGSICLIDSKNRLLFTGDTIQNPSWLHLEESLPLNQFHKNLNRLQSMMDEFEYFLPGHADLQTLPLPKKNIDELTAGIKQILEGKLVGREEKTFAGNGLRCDFGSTGVVYRSDRL
jgi:glyoxylase-like metal-dependent hydrolase (beta-lactamase superfamily II)